MSSRKLEELYVKIGILTEKVNSSCTFCFPTLGGSLNSDNCTKLEPCNSCNDSKDCNNDFYCKDNFCTTAIDPGLL